jgi:putative DNA primase/helicase
VKEYGMPRKSKNAKPKQAPLGRLASAIKPEKTVWIWKDLIAEGCVTVIAGNPGTAKSQIAVTLAAKVSKRGTWPCGGGSAPEGDVVMLIGEDDLAKRIRPLLMAAKANLDRIHLIGEHDDLDYKPIDLSDVEDFDRLCLAIENTRRPKLLIIDPASAFFGHAASNMGGARKLITKLNHWAKYYEIGIVLICHLTRSGGKSALSMIGGSYAIPAAARAVYMAMDDKPGSKYRFLTCVKNNLAPQNITLRYRVETKKVGGFATTRIMWHPKPLRMTADEALAKAKVNGSTQPRAIDAFLKGLLVDGKHGASEIFVQGKQFGFTERQLRAAAKGLAVVKTNTGYGQSKKWFWELPAAAPKSS